MNRASLALLLVLACGGGTQSDGKPGTCSAPARVALPFTAPAGVTTAALGDTLPVCGAPDAFPEAVYGVNLGSATTLHVVANDSSGQGIGVAVHYGFGCFSAVQWCLWRSTGVLDETVPLQGGEYTVVIERNPAGPFTLKLE